MALVWQCDRCRRSSNAGSADDPPEGWEERLMPVRGSEGARSSMVSTLCDACDDQLYAWLHEEGVCTSVISSSYGIYVGTALCGPLVWHVFDGGESGQ